jgi:peptidoglycan/LPS O-acetylase OafA/YrhL
MTAGTTHAAVPRRLPYVAALDGVRALAVAGVVLYHAGVAWVPGGFLGVDVFFVLSGFLITSLLLAERRATGSIDLRAFWIRRARRLLPAAFLVIAVSVLVVAAFVPADLGPTRADAVASFAYANNWAQLLTEHSYFVAFERPSLLQHLWSLAVEEQFYLLWPLALGALLSWLGARRTVAVTLAAALASALLMAALFSPGDDPSRVYYGTDTHASGLLVGALLAFLWPLGRMRRPRRASAVTVLDIAAVAGLAGVVAAMVSWTDYESWVYRGGLVVLALSTALLIAAVTHPACRAGAWLGAGPLRWIGERSYGIYLWHWPVMALTRPGADLDWPRPLLVLGQVGLTIALAAASYRWVERPFRTGTGQRALRGWLDRRPPRGRLAVAVALLFALAVPAAWVAAVDDPPGARASLREHASAAARTAPADGDRAAPRSRPLAVGASVMLAAQRAVGRYTTVDAAVGRQADDILRRLERYRTAGTLPRRVVVQLGENGPPTSAEYRELRRVLGDVSRVVLVNVQVPRRWAGKVNRDLQAAVAAWPQARLADWHAATTRGDLLYDDQTHPNRRGQRVYARLIQALLG